MKSKRRNLWSTQEDYSNCTQLVLHTSWTLKQLSTQDKRLKRKVAYQKTSENYSLQTLLQDTWLCRERAFTFPQEKKSASYYPSEVLMKFIKLFLQLVAIISVIWMSSLAQGRLNNITENYKSAFAVAEEISHNQLFRRWGITYESNNTFKFNQRSCINECFQSQTSYRRT